MYVGSVTAFLFVLPMVSIIIESLLYSVHPDLGFLIGKWFVFWGVGGRLLSAGVRQTLQPEFTAKDIFKIKDKAAYPIVQEIGFGNLCMGVLGIWSLFRPEWVLPAALVGGLYYGLAGIMHVFKKNKNRLEQFATWTDLWIAAILLIFFAANI